MAVRRTAIFIFMCFYSKGTINRFFHFSFEQYAALNKCFHSIVQINGLYQLLFLINHSSGVAQSFIFLFRFMARRIKFCT